MIDYVHLQTAWSSARQLTGISWFIVVVAVISSTFLYALDNTVLANVRPSIIDSFGRIDLLPWVSVADPLGEIGSNPFWGKLNDHINNKILYLVTLAIFEVGTAVCGSAQSMEAVIVGRVIAGFGGSGIYVGTINIISALTTPKEKNHYLNYVGIAWALGTFLGPLIGGAFADSKATWRWAFYINLVAAAVAAPACAFLIPPILSQSSVSTTLWDRITRVDYVGELLWLGGIGSIVSILALGGAVYSWTSPQLIGLYTAAAVAWILFSVQQHFSVFTADRIFPFELITNLDAVRLFYWSAIAIANDTVTIYSLPLLFQSALNLNSLQAALLILPFIAALVVAGGPLGPLFPKFSMYKFWFLGASILMLIAGGFAVIRLGCGPIVQLPFTVGQAKVHRSDAGKITAFLTCAQMTGLVLSLGIATTVFLNGATNDISEIDPDLPRSQMQAAVNGAGSSVFDELTPDDRDRVLRPIARNVGKVFYLSVAGSALGLIVALSMKQERLQLGNQDE
ncbi:putative efflux pump antibiotic resistance protein [Xylariaceae sp. FL1272]|nr:putative efflux pump antibiotic resistance protein [Xylariaceae sp. FL1272]